MSTPPSTTTAATAAASPASQRPPAKRTRASSSHEEQAPGATGSAAPAAAAAAAAVAAGSKRARVSPQTAPSSSSSSDGGLFFKSNNGNGLACLSNFWPFVQPNIARTVETRIAEVYTAAAAAAAAHAELTDGAASVDPQPAAAASAPNAAASPAASSSSSSSASAAASPPPPRDSFVVDGVRYPSVEHYYQSNKYAAAHPSLALQIAAAPIALAAKQMNTKLRKTHPVDRAWFTHANQVAVMQRACEAKFAQNPRLAALLLSTGDAPLHETRGRTTDIWTFQPDDTNCDQLGKILMHIRQALKQQNNVQSG